jgi:hypothetical protein
MLHVHHDSRSVTLCCRAPGRRSTVVLLMLQVHYIMASGTETKVASHSGLAVELLLSPWSLTRYRFCCRRNLQRVPPHHDSPSTRFFLWMQPSSPSFDIFSA